MRPATPLWLAIGLVACGQDPVDLPQLSFDHASQVAFTCLDRTGAVIGSDGCTLDGAVLHALVLQSARGEIASVNLSTNAIVDTQIVVPGFTFDPVGEVPSALVVPRSLPAAGYTFVANSGELDIFVRRTERFLGRRGPEPGQALEIGGAAADLALSPDETRLYAALPDQGLVLEIPIDTDPATVEILGMPRTIALLPDVPVGIPALPRPEYCVECGALVPDPADATMTNFDPRADPALCDRFPEPFPTDRFGNPLPFLPRLTPTRLGDLPRPIELEVDAENGLLLVADEALPIVHVIDISAATGAVALAPMAVGAPTVDVELTPPVPAGLEDTTATERFLYAIDARERSVLVADYTVDIATRQPSAAVLPLGVRGDRPVDRIDFGAGMRVLEAFATTEYDPATPASLLTSCSYAEAGAAQLCGVFVAAGSNDGFVYLIDVYDLDGLRRATTCESDETFAVRRHRPRLATYPSEGVRIVDGPRFTLAGASQTVDDEGHVDLMPSPSLGPVTCPVGQTRLFDEFVCGLDDPWDVRAETWGAVWEGPIPGTAGGRGRLEPQADGTLILYGEVPFCDRGVLGATNVTSLTATDPEVNYAGDLLVVTSFPPPAPPESVDTREADIQRACVELFGEDGEVLLIDPTIATSFEDHLVLMEPRIDLAELAPRIPDVLEGMTALEMLDLCFPELVTFEVHTRDSYSVTGSRAGFLHRVVPDATDGHCVVDTTQDVRNNARAFQERVFENGLVTFQINPDRSASVVRPIRGDDVTFDFTTGDFPAYLVESGGSLVNDLEYTPYASQQSVYAVDLGGTDGLIQLGLRPWDRVTGIE